MGINDIPEDKPLEQIGALKTLSTFYQKNDFVKNFSEIVYRTVVIDITKFKCAVPAIFSMEYGQGVVVRENPRTVRFPYSIKQNDYVEIQLLGGTNFYMLNDDFREAFGIEPPEIREPPF